MEAVTFLIHDFGIESVHEDSPVDLRAAAPMTCLVEATLSYSRLERLAPPLT